MGLNRGRIWMGGVAGGVAWVIWSFLMNVWVGGRYIEVQNAGLFLKQPRYPAFNLQWIVMLVVFGLALRRRD